MLFLLPAFLIFSTVSSRALDSEAFGNRVGNNEVWDRPGLSEDIPDWDRPGASEERWDRPGRAAGELELAARSEDGIEDMALKEESQNMAFGKKEEEKEKVYKDFPRVGLSEVKDFNRIGLSEEQNMAYGKK